MSKRYGIWVEPIGDDAITNDPGFLTNCGRELSFETFEHAEYELDSMWPTGESIMSVREMPEPTDGELEAAIDGFMSIFTEPRSTREAA